VPEPLARQCIRQLRRKEPQLTASTSKFRLDLPGPGSWEQDPVHFPRPVTRYFQEIHPPFFKRGTNDFARFYGMLIDGLQMSYVKGFGYNQMLPTPEAEIPQRFQRAEQVFAQKLWREQLRDWDESCKPSSIAVHRELQAVDPDTLSNTELVAYLTRCRDHHAAMIAQHMRFTAAAVLPTGDFLAHVGDWTGLPPSELLGLMRGSAVVSAGGSDEMERLKKAFAQDTSAGKILESDGDPAQVLASLRSLGGETGAAVSGYLDLVGNRLIDGFDIAEPSALELPDALLRAIRIAVSGEAQAASDVDARIAEVRALVPRRTRTSLTNCSARLASLTASVTSVASTATYGPRVSCGAPPLRLAGGSRIVAASSTPIRCWTPA
jgi:rifampicin phosphotransferase